MVHCVIWLQCLNTICEKDKGKNDFYLFFTFLMTICDAEIKFACHLGGKYLKMNHNMSTYQQLHVK